ncbi:Unknown protein [Striga hermonthica]|uniref:EF-hand domain-containing protein n=1 Tax=Striga hermonthica TaxID=68872 RepID=A0A9N7MKU0_STRHE|nr:Unknown protein [Striga hermonthica]
MVEKIDTDEDAQLDAEEFGALYAVVMAVDGGDEGDDGEEDVRAAFRLPEYDRQGRLRWRWEGQLRQLPENDEVRSVRQGDSRAFASCVGYFACGFEGRVHVMGWQLSFTIGNSQSVDV